MATYLELCRRLHQDIRVGGSITSVTDQTGMLKRVVDSISKADYRIQAAKTNWKFLWSEWERTLTADAIYSPPDDLGSFDESSFWFGVGTDDAFPLSYYSYKQYRDVLRQSYLEAGPVQGIVLMPDGTIKVFPSPNTDDVGKIVTADYWKRPTLMTSNNSVSVIPEQFHDIIIARAKNYFADIQHDSGWYNSSFVEYGDMYQALKAHSLPGMFDDNKSEDSVPLVIEVM